MLELYKEYSGIEFNKIYKDIKLYKFMNDNLIQHNFKYELGLNIDNIQFNPNRFTKGGLNFCDEQSCHLYFDWYGKTLALIEIPDDARIFVEEGKFKADKLIIKEILNFDNIDDEFWIKIVSKNTDALKYVKHQYPELCIAAIEKNYHSFKHVKNQYLTQELCTLAVSKNCQMLEYIKEEFKTDDLCLLAVNCCSSSLQFINNPSEDLCFLAVSKHGYALQYVKTQTPLICNLAVKTHGMALRFVKNQTYEICASAVQQNKFALKFVKQPFREQILEEVYVHDASSSKL